MKHHGVAARIAVWPPQNLSFPLRSHAAPTLRTARRWSAAAAGGTARHRRLSCRRGAKPLDVGLWSGARTDRAGPHGAVSGLSENAPSSVARVFALVTWVTGALVAGWNKYPSNKAVGRRVTPRTARNAGASWRRRDHGPGSCQRPRRSATSDRFADAQAIGRRGPSSTRGARQRGVAGDVLANCARRRQQACAARGVTSYR